LFHSVWSGISARGNKLFKLFKLGYPRGLLGELLAAVGQCFVDFVNCRLSFLCIPLVPERLKLGHHLGLDIDNALAIVRAESQFNAVPIKIRVETVA
jgi:hypothetical protein